jgi:hypothetical protein
MGSNQYVIVERKVDNVNIPNRDAGIAWPWSREGEEKTFEPKVKYGETSEYLLRRLKRDQASNVMLKKVANGHSFKNQERK